MNVALTVRATFIGTLQVVLVPVHAPPQPAKVAPALGAAVSVTLEPVAGLAVHALPPPPQLMPGPVTVPGPVTDTVSGTVAPAPAEKVALTDLEALMSTVQDDAVPPHASRQPVNVEPNAGVAVSTTASSSGKRAVQTFAPFPQLIAPPSPLILPLPVTVTVSSTTSTKVAVTDCAASISTLHVGAVPEHAPLQPVKRLPDTAVAVSTTVELTG